MSAEISIKGVAIWFSHVKDSRLRNRLASLHEGDALFLDADGVVGCWIRMRRPTHAIRPVGSMEQVWSEWFKTRKGERIEIREVTVADDYLASGSTLFSEWNSPEDEEAFGSLSVL